MLIRPYGQPTSTGQTDCLPQSAETLNEPEALTGGQIPTIICQKYCLGPIRHRFRKVRDGVDMSSAIAKDVGMLTWLRSCAASWIAVDCRGLRLWIAVGFHPGPGFTRCPATPAPPSPPSPPMIVTRLRPAAIRLPKASLRHNTCLPCTKRFMASAPPSPSPAAPSKAAVLGSLTNELDKIAPRFEIDAEGISIIREPADFYSGLKVDPRLLHVYRRHGLTHRRNESRKPRSGYSCPHSISGKRNMSWSGYLPQGEAMSDY